MRDTHLMTAPEMDQTVLGRNRPDIMEECTDQSLPGPRSRTGIC